MAHEEASDGHAPRSVTTTTGETIELPVRTEATVLGAAFAVPRTAVEELLPVGLEPIRATPTGDAAITLVSVEHRSVGITGVESYNEFALVLPASDRSPSTSALSTLTQAISGYVWSLPVASEPGRALGEEGWGLPTVLAEITHEDTGSVRETTVTVDDDRFATLELTRPPTMERQTESISYARRGRRLHRIPAEIDGAAGLWPLASEVSVSLGDHPAVAPFEEFSLGEHAIARLAVEGTVTVHPGTPV